MTPYVLYSASFQPLPPLSLSIHLCKLLQNFLFLKVSHKSIHLGRLSPYVSFLLV
eukprot:09840_5